MLNVTEIVGASMACLDQLLNVNIHANCLYIRSDISYNTLKPSLI